MQTRTRRSVWLMMAGTMAMASAMATEPVLFQGSYYQYVPTYTTWNAAKAAAYAMSYEGLPGRLVTITSTAEQAFVSQLMPGGNLVMLGASDAAIEGTWGLGDRAGAGSGVLARRRGRGRHLHRLAPG